VPDLLEQYHAVVADWESGAIAWTAAQNKVPCLILRGVTDIVSLTHGEAYHNIELFHDRSAEIMNTLLTALPDWIHCCHLS
jgi:nucleoside phosphorylase